MLLLHPKIYLDASGTTTDAILIREGRVVAIGNEAREEASDEEDLQQPDGACIFPALGEAHIHLWGLGLRAGTIDLRGMDVPQILTALKQATAPADEWVFASNWDEHHFSSDQNISLQDLDEIFPHNPLCLRRVDGHALWVNSRALQEAGLDEAYISAEGGLAERDDENKLTGRLVDQAMEPILECIPEPTIDDDQAVLLETCHRLREQGFAFCTLAFCPVNRLNMLRKLATEGKLPIFVDVLIDGMDPGLEEALVEGPSRIENLRIGGIKFFADGAMGSAGAHLLSPYRTGGTGLAMHPTGFLKKRIPQLMNQGWQVAVHAIGDAAAREVLDAFEQVPAETRTKLRPRLEHAQIVDPADTPRFAELDVIASIQPIHLRNDAPWAHRRLHPEQLQNLFPWRSLLPATLAAGSDYPIEDLTPWHAISTALTRKGADDIPFQPHHTLTRQEIMAAYTRGAAFAAHCDDEFGDLHPGRPAHLIILDNDPFEATPEEIWNTTVSPIPLPRY